MSAAQTQILELLHSWSTLVHNGFYEERRAQFDILLRELDREPSHAITPLQHVSRYARILDATLPKLGYLTVATLEHLLLRHTDCGHCRVMGRTRVLPSTLRALGLNKLSACVFMLLTMRTAADPLRSVQLFERVLRECPMLRLFLRSNAPQAVQLIPGFTRARLQLSLSVDPFVCEDTARKWAWLTGPESPCRQTMPMEDVVALFTHRQTQADPDDSIASGAVAVFFRSSPLPQSVHQLVRQAVLRDDRPAMHRVLSLYLSTQEPTRQEAQRMLTHVFNPTAQSIVDDHFLAADARLSPAPAMQAHTVAAMLDRHGALGDSVLARVMSNLHSPPAAAAAAPAYDRITEHVRQRPDAKRVNSHVHDKLAWGARAAGEQLDQPSFWIKATRAREEEESEDDEEDGMDHDGGDDDEEEEDGQHQGAGVGLEKQLGDMHVNKKKRGM